MAERRMFAKSVINSARFLTILHRNNLLKSQVLIQRKVIGRKRV